MKFKAYTHLKIRKLNSYQYCSKYGLLAKSHRNIFLYKILVQAAWT